MQGVVMVIGVISCCRWESARPVPSPKTHKGAGLEQVTRAMARMVPPRKGTATITAAQAGPMSSFLRGRGSSSAKATRSGCSRSRTDMT
ncbi:MAG: hypothetical protein CM1200mP2_11530 [Planctomycetaceae bacterium]|nr:MAG: hypothetical protein CM1200mP2_11530 [Planctomycetaceae bacterium]